MYFMENSIQLNNYNHNYIYKELYQNTPNNELLETLRNQEGMTLKFKKVGGRFIHTFCEGRLIYQLGIKPGQVIGRELVDIWPWDIALEKEKFYQMAWSGKEQVTFEAYLNGITFMAALNAVKRKGNVCEVIVSCMDISNIIKEKNALQEREEQYRLITENASGFIGTLDLFGNFTYVSPSYELVFGPNPNLQAGSNIFQFVHPTDFDVLKLQLKEKLISNKRINGEYQFQHHDGSWIILDVNFTAILDEKLNINQIVMEARNISAKKQKQELQWQSEKLSIVSELAAGVAHEIRNPLTSIKGFIQLFQQGVLKEEYFQIIFDELNQLDKTINNYLTLAKPLTNKFIQTSILTLIEQAKLLTASEALLNHVQIKSEIEEDFVIDCEPEHIQQVIINLLKNAIEAMPHGGNVIIKAMKEKYNLVIKVIDNGVGISQERIKKLGKPFYCNKEKGTGLGLMICNHIIKEHSGTITYNSEIGKGTTVEIKIPLVIYD